jgi:hypothetical protein
MLRALILLAVFATANVCAAFGIDYWKSPVSGTWGTASNWTDGTVPTSDDAVTFDQAGTYTVTLAAQPGSVRRITASNGAKTTLQSSGAIKTITLTGVSIPNSLLIDGSGTSLYVGGTSSTSGVNLIRGPGEGAVVSGGATPGLLMIRSGSQVTLPSINIGPEGDASVVVDGVGTLLKVGNVSVRGFDVNPSSTGAGALIFQNQAKGDFGGKVVDLHPITTLATNSNFLVLSGASVTEVGDTIATVNAVQTALIKVDGPSSLSQAAGKILWVGGGGISPGAVQVEIGTSSSGSVLSTGTPGLTLYPLTVGQSGMVKIGSATSTGTLNANADVQVAGGLIQRSAGSTFALADDNPERRSAPLFGELLDRGELPVQRHGQRQDREHRRLNRSWSRRDRGSGIRRNSLSSLWNRCRNQRQWNNYRGRRKYVAHL